MQKKKYISPQREEQKFKLTVSNGTCWSSISDDLKVAMGFKQSAQLIHLLVAEFWFSECNAENSQLGYSHRVNLTNASYN